MVVAMVENGRSVRAEEGEIPLREQWWPEGEVPLVSILCAVYNHELFIRDALEGFLMQETDFPVEIIIHDDASTDGTADVVREYVLRYPRLIRGVYQRENQYSKGRRHFKMLREMVLGRYIAHCEGDDYWTDPRKLAKQVKYLESHPEAVLSFHDVVSVDEHKRIIESSKIRALSGDKRQKKKLSCFSAINRALIPTLSIVYRKYHVKAAPERMKVANGDKYFFAMLSEFGELHDIGEEMGAHRRHSGGVWTAKEPAAKLRENVNTRVAIARTIYHDAILPACFSLGELAWHVYWKKCGQAAVSERMYYLRVYLLSIPCCLRYLKKSPISIFPVVKTQLAIMRIAVVDLGGLLRRWRGKRG